MQIIKVLHREINPDSDYEFTLARAAFVIHFARELIRVDKGASGGAHAQAIFMSGMPRHGGGYRSLPTSLAKLKIFLRSRHFCPTM